MKEKAQAIIEKMIDKEIETHVRIVKRIPKWLHSGESELEAVLMVERVFPNLRKAHYDREIATWSGDVTLYLEVDHIRDVVAPIRLIRSLGHKLTGASMPNGETQIYAEWTFNNGKLKLQAHLAKDSKCRLEVIEEIEETVTRKKYKMVCDE